jgi:hypothetical protein
MCQTLIRRGIIFFAFALALGGNGVASKVESPLCVGPTDVVRLIALEDPDAADSYIITVKNRTKSTILAFRVGDGGKSELHAIHYAIPTSISGPIGWQAGHAFWESSSFMYWYWNAQAQDKGIRPNGFVSGFTLILPKMPPNVVGQLYPDGSKVVLIKPQSLPFRTHHADGSCFWGRVSLSLLK